MRKIVPVLVATVMLSSSVAFAADETAVKKPGALAKTYAASVKLVKKPFRMMATVGKLGSAAGLVIFAALETKLKD